MLGCGFSIAAISQNTFPANGNVGIRTPEPSTDLDMYGNALFRDTLVIGKKFRVGTTAEHRVTIKYVQGNAEYPDLFKISAPAGSKPIRGDINGGIANEDSNPNFDCFAAAPIPPVVNALSHAVSVAYNPVNPNVPGGQILMGHNGVNAFFESQSVATTYPGNINHPGDLFINRYCNRNVLFFAHAVPFGIGLTNVVSIDGSLNVRTKIQLGVSGNSFVSSTDKLYIYNPVGQLTNGIKIKHGTPNFALQIATYNNTSAILVNNGVNSTQDGPESFRVNGSGQTIITSSATDALVIKNASNVVNFKVKNTGETFSRHVKVMMTAFPDYVFKPGYDLKPLSEVEAYYKKNHHLPEIPSEEEVLKNDLDLGEMNSLLLKKVEELTIYLVEQDKKINALSAELSSLKNATKER